MTSFSTKLVCAMLSVLGSTSLVAFVDPASAVAHAPAAHHQAAPAVALTGVVAPRG